MKSERKHKLQFILAGSLLSLVMFLAVLIAIGLMMWGFMTEISGVGWDATLMGGLG